VPGPRRALYGLGCELVEILPYVAIADRVRIVVAMFSERDTLTFGITSDYGSVPDIEVLSSGIARSMTELVTSVRPVDRHGYQRAFGPVAAAGVEAR
jgi:hypothetical protein